MDKFDETMKDAATQMSILCETPIENSEKGIHDALAYIFKHCSCNDQAKATMIQTRWMWAHCEKTYHASTPAAK